MTLRRWQAIALGSTAAVALAGCFTGPKQPPTAAPPTPVTVVAPLAPPPEFIPDAIPRVEPRSRYGNPAFYDVLGKRYYVLSSSTAYVERGVASWYGPGFHQVRTSSGEPYDMYAMTAAHKTLPLPAYVSVTNLQNGKSVVVRVNDRGPFVGNRIIDLSYTAAARLDMLRHGTAMVEVRALDPATSTDPAPVSTPRMPLFVQAGAFADPANAERLAGKLRGASFENIFVRDDFIAGRHLYRVRIGPVPDVAQFDQLVAELEHSGVHDAHLALD